MPQYHIDIVTKLYLITSKDFNTNKKFNIFSQYKNGKELSLRILHILGSINFVRYILTDLVPNDNIWILRIKYITIYYANKNLKRIIDEIPDFPIKELLNKNEHLFDTEFRSCMMHYSFINKGKYIIDDNYLNLNIPFFWID